MDSPRVAIVYHSGHGHTAKLAEAIAAGVARVGASTTLVSLDAENTPWDALEAADAIIFGSPTYMAGPSAVFKAFQESTSKRIWIDGLKWKNKFAAGFTSSASRSGDKLATLTQMALFAAQHGMIWISLGMMPGHHSSTGSENDLNRLGFYLGVGAQANSDEPADVAPPLSDLLTAQHLGERVATVAAQMLRGQRPA